MKNLKIIGSSIFEQWGIPNWKGLNTTNAAIGGTTAAYWARNINNSISPSIWNYAIYCGSNDLNQDIPASSIIMNIVSIITTVQEAANMNQVAYFSIMKAPQKNGFFRVIDQINKAVSQHLRKQDLYIDMNHIINQDPKWYKEDQLHLTEACYHEIEKKAGSIVEQWVV